MDRDYNYDKQVALLLQKKIIRNRKVKFKQAYVAIECMIENYKKCLYGITLNKSNDYLNEIRSYIVEINQFAFSAQMNLKEYKKARAEIMRLKNG